MSNILSISPETLKAFQAKRAEINRLVVARALERQGEVAQHGEQAQELIAAGIDFTTQMLETAMQFGDIATLDYQLAWAWDRLPHDGVAPAHLISRFRIYADVVAGLLPARQAGEITPYLDWMMARQQELMSAATAAAG